MRVSILSLVLKENVQIILLLRVLKGLGLYLYNIIYGISETSALGIFNNDKEY